MLCFDSYYSPEVGSVLRFNAERFRLKILPVNLGTHAGLDRDVQETDGQPGRAKVP